MPKQIINKVKPAAPQARTVTSHTPTSSPGVSPTKSYTVTTPVPGSTRTVNEGRKD